MQPYIARLGRFVLVVGCLWIVTFPAATEGVRELKWEDLMPKDWNPKAVLEKALDGKEASELMDSAPEAQRLLIEYMTAMSAAPVIPELDGQQVQLAGYVVPLEFGGSEVTEFLLVPYFGACIHVPPPPANQIVYVKTENAYPITGLFDAVKVSGTLKAKVYRNLLGDAGYSMEVDKVEPHY